MYTPDSTLNHVDTGKTQIAIYVKEVSEDMDKLRNDYLIYMGCQKTLFAETTHFL